VSDTIKIRRIDVTDEDQVNPTHVDISYSVHSTSTDVTDAKGTDEVTRGVVRCTSTRGAAATFLATCHILNAGALTPAVLALLTGQGLQNP
jgi:hypothetical protein